MYKSYKKDVKKALSKSYHDALYKIGLDWQRFASIIITGNGNVDTGRLRASIAFVVGDTVGRNKQYNGDIDSKDIPKGKTAENVLQIGTNVKYAPSIEKKYPFLKPAFMMNKKVYQKILDDTIEGELK